MKTFCLVYKNMFTSKGSGLLDSLGLKTPQIRVMERF